MTCRRHFECLRSVAYAGLLAGPLAGCSADAALVRADWSWWSSGSKAAPPPLGLAAAPAEALITSDGACPAESVASPGRGIGLGMTECDLVRLAGRPVGIELGANERGERSAVLTYPQGDRAGIYRFNSGVLVTIERLPEAAVAAKPANPRAKRSAQRKSQTAASRSAM